LDIPKDNVIDVATNQLGRRKLIRQVLQSFWRRWNHEYLQTLQGRKSKLYAQVYEPMIKINPQSYDQPGPVVQCKSNEEKKTCRDIDTQDNDVSDTSEKDIGTKLPSI